MPIPIEEVHELRNYIDRVVSRADHHGHQVNEICFALVGGVIWKADSIQVRGSDPDDPKNVLTMSVDGQAYAFCFNHSTGHIDVRRDNYRGQTITTFSNESTCADVKEFFAELGAVTA